MLPDDERSSRAGRWINQKIVSVEAVTRTLLECNCYVEGESSVTRDDFRRWRESIASRRDVSGRGRKGAPP